MALTMEQLGRRVAEGRASLLGKGLKVNAGKSKVMIGSSGGKMIVNSVQWPCGVCGKGLQASSSSCHQTFVFHFSTHFFAISLKLLRSSNEQGSARRVHCIMCAVFSVARPHSHVASPSKYPHVCLCSLLHVNPVRIRFRHLYVVHGLSYPLARLSFRLTVTLCGVVCNPKPFISLYDPSREFSRFHTTQTLCIAQYVKIGLTNSDVVYVVTCRVQLTV